jgi:hypothetical protein
VITVIEDQRAVGGEDRVPDDERNVVGAAGQPESLLDRVVEVVLGRQSEVGVLGRDADRVVVVPQGASVLDVRVVVVLPLPRL